MVEVYTLQKTKASCCSYNYLTFKCLNTTMVRVFLRLNIWYQVSLCLITACGQFQKTF